jgi:hypothetical protein
VNLYLETTSKKAASVVYKTKWLYFREAQTVETGRTWIFTDGSSSGWFAAVIIDTKAARVRYGAAHAKPVSANVGPELCGLILGLTLAPSHSPITVVHDYNGVGAWTAGAWKVDPDKPKLALLIDRAREIIQQRKLDVLFVHHGGHQTNDTDFTRWNIVADELCTAQKLVDREEPWS